MTVSVLVPTRNDSQYLPLVIEHYTEGIDPSSLELIIINDGSVEPTGKFKPIYPSEFNYPLKVINTPVSRGVGYSLDRAAELATGDILVISGNDVLVRKGRWYNDITNAVREYPESLCVAASVGLSPMKLDMDREDRKVRYGADFIVQVSKDDLPPNSDLRKVENYSDIFKGRWRTTKDSDNPYPISCPMGACYFTSRDYFLKTRGWDTNPKNRWQGFRAWGGLEPWISLKYWLSGGSVLMFPNIEAGHIYGRRTRENKYKGGARSEVDIYWNRLFMAHTMIIDEGLRKEIIDWLHPCLNLGVAKNRIRQNYSSILEVRERNKNIFIHDMQWFMERFNIKLK